MAWLAVGCAAGRPAGPGATGASPPGPAAVARPSLAEPPPVSVVPVGAPDEDYRLAPDDRLSLTVYGQKDLTRTLRVGQAGTITVPLLGEVHAAGLSTSELERRIEAGLRGRYLMTPRVTVTVTEYQGRRIGVLGAVNEPGAFTLRANHTTVLQALSEAKGVKDNAARVAYVVRARPRPGEPAPVPVDLDALLRVGESGQNVVLDPGDSVYVPESSTFYAAGEVERRGAYTLRRDTTLAKALTEAGGVTKRAASGQVKVVRTLSTGEKQELGPFDLQAVLNGDPRQNIALQPQDVVVVPQSGAKSAGYAFLEVLKGILRISLLAL